MESPIAKGPFDWSKFNCTMNLVLPDMYTIEPISIHIVIQKILNKSGRTTGNFSKRYIPFFIYPQYLIIIMSRFEVDCMKTQEEKTLQFVDISE